MPPPKLVKVTLDPGERRNLGLAVVFTDVEGKVLVIEITSGGAAEVSGVTIGDQIISIDGIPVTDLPQVEVNEKLNCGKPTKLTIHPAITDQELPMVYNNMTTADVEGAVTSPTLPLLISFLFWCKGKPILFNEYG
jgi:C-terminal processing protease CtpA/Prc